MSKESNGTATIVCPVCGEAFTGHPAVSRTDNETLICSDCGIRQALESIGVDYLEQNEILRIIHRAENASASN